VKSLRLLSALLLVVLLAERAHAHPHVWITSPANDHASGPITDGVRHAWTFDEMFAAYG